MGFFAAVQDVCPASVRILYLGMESIFGKGYQNTGTDSACFRTEVWKAGANRIWTEAKNKLSYIFSKDRKRDDLIQTFKIMRGLAEVPWHSVLVKGEWDTENHQENDSESM